MACSEKTRDSAASTAIGGILDSRRASHDDAVAPVFLRASSDDCARSPHLPASVETRLNSRSIALTDSSLDSAEGDDTARNDITARRHLVYRASLAHVQGEEVGDQPLGIVTSEPPHEIPGKKRLTRPCCSLACTRRGRLSHLCLPTKVRLEFAVTCWRIFHMARPRTGPLV